MNTNKVETLDNPLARHSESIPFGEVLPRRSRLHIDALEAYIDYLQLSGKLIEPPIRNVIDTSRPLLELVSANLTIIPLSLRAIFTLSTASTSIPGGWSFFSKGCTEKMAGSMSGFAAMASRVKRPTFWKSSERVDLPA